MGRQSLPVPQARGLQQRLARHIRARYGTWAAFEHELGLPHATVSGWRHGTTTPEVPHLLALARKGRVSPTWLLLGTGPELLPRSSPPQRRTT